MCGWFKVASRRASRAKPRDAVRIAGQSRRQHLDGDLAMQSRIEGAIHLTHATGIERAQNAVWSELGPCSQRGHSAVRDRSILEHQRIDRRTLGKRSRIGVRREQRFHFMLERDVLATGLAQEHRALIRRTRQRRVKDLLDPRPSTDRPS